MRTTIRVPASSANLGPGFDILALALPLLLEVSATATDNGKVIINGHDRTDDVGDNAIAAAYLAVCDALSLARDQRGVVMEATSKIPIGYGLGSSAAARLAGVLTATSLHQATWDDKKILDCVTELEGHGDNAAAALHGGFVICAEGAPVTRLDIPEDIRAILFLPDVTIPTEAAREVVPMVYSREDAVFNAGHVALLVYAMATRDTTLLATAMEDRWHQPKRAALMPWLEPVMKAAREAGALGAALSGAGSAVIALAVSNMDEIARAMLDAAGVSGETRVLTPQNHGARVEIAP